MKTKKFLNVFVLFFVATLFLTTSCRDDDEETTDYHKVMTDYMKSNSLDLSDMASEWIISAADVNAKGADDFYIIDIRNEEDFNLGRIAGAYNTTLGNILTEAENADKPILVVCYTGQSAAHGLVALRLSGYSDCKSLKFGMSSWNADFDKWTANIDSIAEGNDNWSTTNTIETPVTFSTPDFTTTATTGKEILAERVDIMLAGGFQGVSGSDVLDAPANYFINNYWAEADVDLYGHIVGAYRIKEDLTLVAGGFENLDKDATVVTYCWTGQTSSLVTAYLTVLGYNDAKSLKFGANGMIYNALLAHKWVASGDYPYEN